MGTWEGVSGLGSGVYKPTPELTNHQSLFTITLFTITKIIIPTMMNFEPSNPPILDPDFLSHLQDIKADFERLERARSLSFSPIQNYTLPATLTPPHPNNLTPPPSAVKSSPLTFRPPRHSPYQPITLNKSAFLPNPNFKPPSTATPPSRYAIATKISAKVFAPAKLIHNSLTVVSNNQLPLTAVTAATSAPIPKTSEKVSLPTSNCKAVSLQQQGSTTSKLYQEITNAYHAAPASMPKHLPTHKPRKDRTKITKEQTAVLKENFSQSIYLSKANRGLLSKELGMEEITVRFWFQNQRRLFKRTQQLA